MHEFGLAEDVLRKIKELKSPAKKYLVKVGESLAVTAEELKDAYDLVSVGSAYNGTELDIEIVPVKAACSKCRTEFAPRTFRLDCPKCGSHSIQLVSGQGIEVIPSPKV